MNFNFLSLHEHWELEQSKYYSPCSTILTVAFLCSQHPPLQGQTAAHSDPCSSSGTALLNHHIDPVLPTTFNFPP